MKPMIEPAETRGWKAFDAPTQAWLHDRRLAALQWWKRQHGRAVLRQQPHGNQVSNEPFLYASFLERDGVVDLDLRDDGSVLVRARHLAGDEA